MSINQSINYKLYNYAYKAKGTILRSIPNSFVPKRRNLSGVLQIGITTYVDRYDIFFKPLYHSLKLLFPEVQIIVAVNGFHDREIQKLYLTRFHRQICVDNINSNKFVLHDNPVGLTRLWNEILSQGNNKTTLILNDDLRVFPWLRIWIEKELWNSSITLMNGTWSHFFICKDVLDLVGWFDENFRGIGFEDMDYTARCAYKGVVIQNLRCQYITHLDHQPSRTSFDDQTQTLWGSKYSSINHDAFFQKWKICDHDSGIFIKQLNSFVIPNNLDSEKGEEINLIFKDNICYPDRH